MKLPVTIFFIGLVVSSFSQEDTSSAHQFNVVTVVHPKSEQMSLVDLNASNPTYLISRDKMRDLGVLDVGEALKFVPSAQIKDYGGIGGIKTIAYRGLGSSHTGLILDGVWVPSMQTGTINLSGYELFGLNYIEFSTGSIDDPFTCTSASVPASLINVSTELSARPARTEARLYSALTSINAYEHGAQLRIPIGKRSFIGAQYLLRHGSGQYPFVYPLSGNDSTYTRTNTNLLNQRYRLALGTKWTLFGKYQGKAFASFSQQYNSQQLPSAFILYNPQGEQELNTQNSRCLFTVNQVIKKWSISMNGFYYHNNLDYRDPHFLNAEGFLESNYRQTSLGTGAKISLKLNEKTFVYGGSDFIYGLLQSSEIIKAPERTNLNSLFGINIWLVKNKLQLQTNLATQFVKDIYTSEDTLNQVAYFKPNPYVSLSYLPFEKSSFRIRAFYKNTFRMPTFNDLYYNYIGNTNLKPEAAQISNIGLTWGKRIKRFKLETSLDAYYNKVKNKIVAIPTKDLFNWSMQNIGEVEIKGVDFSFLATYMGEKVKIFLTTTHNFNQSKDVTNPDGATFGHQIPYTPFYAGSHSLAAAFQGFRLHSSLIHTGERYTLNENILANHLDGFVDMNLGLSYKKDFEKYSGSVDLSVMNLFNNNYEVIRSYPMPGRYYQMTLRFNYQCE